MSDDLWTPERVEDRLIEAAEVLKRLPDQRVQGYYNTWPKMMLEFADLVEQKPVMKRPWIEPAAIDRMEETLTWFGWLDKLDTQITWRRASKKPWKYICRDVGLSRSAAHEHWIFSLAVITLRLNGRRVPSKRSRRFVIARARAA